jgi:hypothetical protein
MHNRRLKHVVKNDLSDSDFLPQTVNVRTLAPNAEERALRIGTFFQHDAIGEQLTAQMLRRPRQEQLGLDQTLGEKGTDRFVKLGNITLINCAHHNALRKLRA